MMIDSDVVELAVNQIAPALVVLSELMNADEQPGPVRVASAKAVIDYALKLSEKKEAAADSLAKLDALLEEYRKDAGMYPWE